MITIVLSVTQKYKVLWDNLIVTPDLGGEGGRCGHKDYHEGTTFEPRSEGSRAIN